MRKTAHNLKHNKMNNRINLKGMLLLLLLVVSAMAKAQTHEFAPVGAEWYYERYYREGLIPSGITYDRFLSLRTVVINGWECKEIELFQNLDCYGEVNPYTEIRYITQEGDKVYEVEDGQRFLLYDFGKEVGEWWYAPKYNDTIYVSWVDSIQLQDGNYRKRLHTWPKNNTYLYYTHIIEGIGTDLSIFPFEMLVGSPCMHSNLRCYFENGFPLIMSEMSECDYEVLAVEECGGTSIALMNTVVEDVLHIDFAETASLPRQIRITDALGKTLYAQKTMDKSLDISFTDKPAGLYLVQIVMDSIVINNKIVKR